MPTVVTTPMVAVVSVIVEAQPQMRKTIIERVVIAVVVIRVTIEPVVVQMQSVGIPANAERRGHTPEMPGGEVIVPGIRVVVQRVTVRVVVIYRITLINRYPLRLVIRHINYFRICRPDFNRAFIVHHNDLVLVALQIAGHPCAFAEIAYRRNQFGLLNEHRLAKLPGPVEILVQQRNDFRVVQQRNNGIVPVLIGLEIQIVFAGFEKAGSLDNLYRVGRSR